MSNGNGSKPFWRSRMLWVNAVSLAAVVATAFGLIQPLPAELEPVAEVIVLAINLVLRLRTDQAVSLSG